MLKTNPISKEEAEKFSKILHDLINNLDEVFGKDKYSCYLNMVYKEPDKKPLSFSALSKVEDEAKDEEWMGIQASSLAEDSFANHAVLSHAFNKIMASFIDVSPDTDNLLSKNPAKDDEIIN
jgi:hypothetical protein